MVKSYSILDKYSLDNTDNNKIGFDCLKMISSSEWIITIDSMNMGNQI